MIKPLDDFVLVERIKSKEMSEGGIYLPDNSRVKATTGQVLAIGPGRWVEDGVLEPMKVAVGEKVIFGKYSGVEVDGDDIILLKQQEIIAKIE